MGEIAVPGLHAAARDDDEAVGSKPIGLARPAHQGDPIEQLVADLREPRSDDDRLVAVGDLGESLIGQRGEFLDSAARSLRSNRRAA